MCKAFSANATGPVRRLDSAFRPCATAEGPPHPLGAALCSRRAPPAGTSVPAAARHQGLSERPAPPPRTAPYQALCYLSSAARGASWLSLVALSRHRDLACRLRRLDPPLRSGPTRGAAPGLRRGHPVVGALEALCSLAGVLGRGHRGPGPAGALRAVWGAGAQGQERIGRPQAAGGLFPCRPSPPPLSVTDFRSSNKT